MELGDETLLFAEHSALGRPVTLAVLGHGERILEEDLRSARCLIDLRHERIAEVTDIVTADDEGLAYLVMEPPGERSLADELSTKKGLELARALGIAVQVTEALEAAQGGGCRFGPLDPRCVILGERSGQRDFVTLFLTGCGDADVVDELGRLLAAMLERVVVAERSSSRLTELRELVESFSNEEVRPSSTLAMVREKLLAIAERRSLELERFVHLPKAGRARGVIIAVAMLAVIVGVGLALFLRPSFWQPLEQHRDELRSSSSDSAPERAERLDALRRRDRHQRDQR
jgi:hypothetical protein